MRYSFNNKEKMARFFNDDGEIAYAKLGLSGPCLNIEFPSDWHEEKRAWIHIGLGLFKVCFSFPWHKTVPDEGQCSGVRYGFYFFEDTFVVMYGKTKGRKGDPMKHFYLPWSWRFKNRQNKSGSIVMPYTYVMNNGTVQHRTATAFSEEFVHTRPWLPWKRTTKIVDIEFDAEVGERTGTWKGGTLGCSYPMLKKETVMNAVRRMEKNRRFHR
jgi:hypothetical protein